MKQAAIVCAGLWLTSAATLAGQVPGPASAPDIPISGKDRVYTADQTSNTVSVYDPAADKLLGLIRLGAATPQNLTPLYKGQLLVHGLGFSPDHRTLAVVSVGSNSVTFIDTATNKVKHVIYVGRSPHEAFFTPDGRELWVTIRGEDYVAVLDPQSYREKSRIPVVNGPGMTIFRPDGKYGFVCSSFSPELSVIEVATHRVVAQVKQASPFCPDLAATPDGKQVWFTLKDIGKTQVVSAEPPFGEIALLDTGPITNHVNFARNRNGQFAYVTIGGDNTVKVFTADAQPKQVAEIPTGDLPHGLWPSGDGTRMYIALENGAGVAVIDTVANKEIARIPGGQSPQALVYVPDAVPEGAGTANLEPLGAIGTVAHLALASPGASKPSTTVAVNSQGLIDFIEAAITGLKPKSRYQLALAEQPKAPFGRLEPLADFQTNPAGAAVVATFGPLKDVAPKGQAAPRRYLVIRPVADSGPGEPVQVPVSAR